MSKKKSLVGVKVIKGDINRALKQFKKKVSESGHITELRERQEFTKPTTIRRRKKQLAIREEQKRVILERIAEGDTTIRFYTKKRKKTNNSSEKKKENKKSLKNDSLD